LGAESLREMIQTIYMPLVDEGTDVWRPVEAELIEGDLLRVLGEVPEDEIWMFPPGSVVRCREHVFSGGKRALAAYAIG
jgi:hypothetical protein